MGEQQERALRQEIERLKKRLRLSSGSPFVRTPSGSAGDVVGPAASTDHAFARWDGATGKLLQDSTGTSIDDAGRATFKSVHIPLFDAGNSGASITIDWADSIRQRLTLTDDAALTFDNPVDGDALVLLLDAGAGGFTPTYPAEVRFPDDVEPDTTPAGMTILLTFLYRADVDRYVGSFNEHYDLS